MGTLLSPPMLANTRCGQPSTTSSISPRRWINSGGLGTMGFGLPTAMRGATGSSGFSGRLRHRRGIDPDEHSGAGLQAVRLPIKVVMLNNRYLGMVRQWRNLSRQPLFSPTWIRCPISRGSPSPVMWVSASTSRAMWKEPCGRRSVARAIWSSLIFRSTRPRTYTPWSRAERV